MPCYDPLPAEHAESRKARLDFLTRNLCHLFHDLQAEGKLEQFSEKYPELGRWWKIHQKEDMMRESIERKMVNREELTQEEINFTWSAFL